MKYLQTFVIGCIFVLAISLVPHIAENNWATVFALLLLTTVVWFAYKVGEHFHHGHTHEGDSSLDSSIGFSLIGVNILHPMVDGFALYGTYTSESKYLFLSILIGVVIHEVFRQSALIVVFKEFGFRAWNVVLLAFTGMTFGWLIGVIGGNLPVVLEPYIDALTFGAYAFIVFEYLFAHQETFKNRKLIYSLFFGILVAIIFITLFRAH